MEDGSAGMIGPSSNLCGWTPGLLYDKLIVRYERINLCPAMKLAALIAIWLIASMTFSSVVEAFLIAGTGKISEEMRVDE